jgi:hypothetical protein
LKGLRPFKKDSFPLSFEGEGDKATVLTNKENNSKEYDI